jgi:hypothetical protein
MQFEVIQYAASACAALRVMLTTPARDRSRFIENRRRSTRCVDTVDRWRRFLPATQELKGNDFGG